MDLNGKKIAFLGDSITEGVGVADLENLYWKRIARMTGADCYGYGISGTRIALQNTPSENPRFDLTFGSRVDTMIPDADVVVVFGGTNDFGHGDAAFGSFSDRTERTFCGAYHLLMEKLLNRYPNAQLVVMTPLHRCIEDQADYMDSGLRRQGPLSRYVDAIREIAAYYGVPVVDLFRNCTIQPRVPILKERFCPDGLHPNDDGHVRIANCLLGVLKTL